MKIGNEEVVIKLESAQVFITQKVFDAGWTAGFKRGREHRCEDKQIGWCLGGFIIGISFSVFLFWMSNN